MLCINVRVYPKKREKKKYIQHKLSSQDVTEEALFHTVPHFSDFPVSEEQTCHTEAACCIAVNLVMQLIFVFAHAGSATTF